MQKAFTDYINRLVDESSTQADRVMDIQHLSGCIHVAIKELQEWLNMVKDMAREHSK